jgi:xanthosine utilization system XapX-like protein
MRNGFHRRFVWPFFAGDLLGRSLFVNLIKGESPRLETLFGLLCIFMGTRAVQFAQSIFPSLEVPLTAACVAGLLYGAIFHVLRRTKGKTHQPDSLTSKLVLWTGTGMMFILFATALTWKFPLWYGEVLYGVLFIRRAWKEFRQFIHPKRIGKIVL